MTAKKKGKGPKKEAFFVADVGGTNCRFGVYDPEFRELAKGIVATSSISSLPAAVNDFLARTLQTNPTAIQIGKAVFSVAGPVFDGRFAELTNAKLAVSADELEKSTPLKKVRILNDLEAMGIGVQSLKDDAKAVISKPSQKSMLRNNIQVVIAPGTGLGVSILVRQSNKSRLVPFPSEAGHMPLLHYAGMESIERMMLLKEIPLEQEEVLSGRGMKLLYDDALAKSSFFSRHSAIRRKIANSDDPSASIVKAAAEGDTVSSNTMEMFVKHLALTAQAFALALLPSRIYLAGGIPPKIRQFIERSFMRHFTRHSRYTELLEQVEIVLCLDEEIGLYGCFLAAKGAD